MKTTGLIHRSAIFQVMAFIAIVSLVAACQAAPTQTKVGLKILAVETFLQDIAQNVAGQRAQVESLIPVGMDPHSFEPTPQDVARISDSSVLIVNGAGLEEWLAKTLNNAGGQHVVIEASSGLTSRTPTPGEASLLDPPEIERDPHFWLDPTQVIHYVETIRDGLTKADPDGKDVYAQNAGAYIARLNELDAWIKQQVDQIPPQERLLVTNHETFGYFADRYGFRIVGTIIPSVTSGATPSAQQLANLIDQVKASAAPALFLEAGVNPDLARQISAETGAKIVTDLFTHSITASDGPAPTYLKMMRYNTNSIVNALK